MSAEERQERRRAAKIKYRTSDKGKRVSRAYYADNREGWNKNWRALMLRRYGLTEERYSDILSKQQGVCAICGNPPDSKRLAVDHDHKANVIRGLLCWTCNRTIMGAIDRLKVDPMRIIEHMRNNYGSCPV